jgi:hypothetical protein
MGSYAPESWPPSRPRDGASVAGSGPAEVCFEDHAQLIPVAGRTLGPFKGGSTGRTPAPLPSWAVDLDARDPASSAGSAHADSSRIPP